MRSLLLALLFLPACTGQDTDTDSDAVELIDGSYARLDGFGVLGVQEYSDGSAVGYLCGQGEHLSETRWLAGADGELTGQDVSVTLSGDGAQVVAGSEQWSPSLAPLAGGGLFEASPEGCRTGLIVFPDGDGFAAAGTFCDLDQSFFQVEPVGTIVAPQDRVSVRVVTDADTLTFDMTRIP